MVELNPSSRNVPRVAQRRTVKRPVRIGILLLFIFSILIALVYCGLVVQVVRQHGSTATSHANFLAPNNKALSINITSNQSDVWGKLLTKERTNYADWRDLAVQLAALPADQILSILKTHDPFGVRNFEQRLLQTESDRQAILKIDDVKNLFPCPAQRITIPDQRNHDRARKYRQGLKELKQPKDDFVFMFFQHLRKAGGTNFCTLAQHNLVKPQVPR